MPVPVALRNGDISTVPASKTTKRPSRAPGGTAAARAQFPHLAIECVSPELDGGRFPVKRVIGDALRVGADVFKDGHDLLAARVRYRGPTQPEWRHEPMTFDYNTDRWTASIPLDEIGRWTFTVEAWSDRWRTWRSELEKKVGAGQDVSSELLEGAELVDEASRRVRFGTVRNNLRSLAASLRASGVEQQSRVNVALSGELFALMEEHLPPADLTSCGRELDVIVDRERARFASWYELFPRSLSPIPGRHGTFADAERMLPRIAELGFDVIYLPPIHPIGTTNRKGKNNALVAGPDDPGSPWAIGSEHGGHDAVDPRLGTLDDFDRFVARAAELGIEIALDYALQCSPDHPWLREHPDWFFVRPDGTLKYAENPPKKYQDIYPINFWCADRESLWAACRDVLLHWIEHGVRTFRVDNPHTKPFAFWEWTIGEVQSRHPDVIFLAEAFTRPKRMKHLAKLGFTQSYSYFTWRNTAAELREYLTELTQTPVAEYMRVNFFANTPDILHEFLQRGGRPAFRLRLLLAATLSPVYGIYSGFELIENTPLKQGSEEYLDSEKYQLRQRDWNAAGNINTDVARINWIRRDNRALQLYTNISFHPSENDNILFFRKSAPGNELLIAVNTDPFTPQETVVHVPIEALGIGPHASFVVHDLMTGAHYTWRGARNYVRLDPAEQAGHVMRVERVM
ncbi:MAG TPA: alpha-1,4-glucan--maltose-1-phosphate maltosyltransferase [Gemmatimonadaceae bacterium]|jgi:starch synthase (maltosyl-transferring)|nr:alpha-1,4-glucan--maltose-1-phosphate maltosyltransferase [Gemmatimonadaceae bacterium]